MHKGPTIWPLNRDAFDVADVDDAATSFRDLNFIVEHVGLPRLEDFCWLRDLEPGPETAVYLQRRAELGLAVDDDAPVVLTVDGDAVPAQELDAYLARIRAVDVSVEGNAGLCRGLLATRYPGTERPAEPLSRPAVSAWQRSEAR